MDDFFHGQLDHATHNSRATALAEPLASASVTHKPGPTISPSRPPRPRVPLQHIAVMSRHAHTQSGSDQRFPATSAIDRSDQAGPSEAPGSLGSGHPIRSVGGRLIARVRQPSFSPWRAARAAAGWSGRMERGGGVAVEDGHGSVESGAVNWIVLVSQPARSSRAGQKPSLGMVHHRPGARLWKLGRMPSPFEPPDAPSSLGPRGGCSSRAEDCPAGPPGRKSWPRAPLERVEWGVVAAL